MRMTWLIAVGLLLCGCIPPSHTHNPELQRALASVEAVLETGGSYGELRSRITDVRAAYRLAKLSDTQEKLYRVWVQWSDSWIRYMDESQRYLGKELEPNKPPDAKYFMDLTKTVRKLL